MKIIHFSDTHLWIWLENTIRENDFYNNFELVIDDILEKNPDIVIHSWDLFHNSKPSNKAISIVVKNFLKLKEKNIKVIIIAWNHDTPRLSTTTHPFEIFNSFENFFVYFEAEVSVLDIDDYRFVCLPHIHDENIFKEKFKKWIELINKNKKNIFISHFWLASSDYDEYTDEISGVNISVSDLKLLKNFDYVALWHYHKNFCMWNICYAWSIERTSFNQKNYKNWYNEITFDNWKTNINSLYLLSRNMIDLWIIDCFAFEKTTDLITYLENKFNKIDLEWAIVKIIFENINNKLMLDFDEKIIYTFFEKTFYFEFKKLVTLKNQEFLNKINQFWNTILDNFDSFMDNYEIKNDMIKKQISDELKTEIKNL